MKEESVLLGAGVSVEAGIPTSLGMTQRVVEKLEEAGARIQPALHAVYFALGGLMFGRGQQGKPPTLIDVEALFNAMDLLANRERSELAPFVASWNEPKADVGAFAGRDLGETIAAAALEEHGAFMHGEKLVSKIREIAGGAKLPYRFAQEEMIRTLTSIVWGNEPGPWDYLRPLVERANSSEDFAIATLNYDNGVEMAAAQHGVALSTGFELEATAVTPAFADGQIPLIKLHGSIDWQRGGKWAPDEQHFPEYSVTRVADPTAVKASHRYEPALVFGGGNKLRPDGPFLDLLAAFRERLERSEQLTIIGYSFRDDHVNHVIARWFNAKSDRALRIVDPDFRGVWGYSEERHFLHDLTTKLRTSDRVSLIEIGAGEALKRMWS